MTPTLAEIEALLHAATPGPWRWDGNLNTKEVYLVAMAKGRPYVMDFVRWGMAGASPRFQVRGEDGFGVMTRIDEGLAVKEREYRGDIERIDHPDAALIARAPEVITRLLRLVREQERRLAEIATMTSAKLLPPSMRTADRQRIHALATKETP